ncbi:hypothetical protein GLAREA_03218 [Glarea lozoyensis ATCC 20868]|uniref:DUF7514 domain-containing protein n=1 Tax=Glarea lozoyensis (strain ATCC 20868 / MF5171) TaxID=1116229 RepID=S3DL83_GLAL2|nr:uncharacterized protein GLAREA_03218 [Glarea lozoyensis ATCC 20868]EPE27303.1 hypothetical protein GLAREA_03218 [Glarea lozoyensis ATCC 20868]
MAYEYDEYGRLRGNGESAFFEPSHPIPEHYPTTDYYSDSRDNIPRRPDDRQRASPLKQNRAQKMSTTSMDSDSSEHVSAETIAAITERIKQEVLEHLKQTGSMDGQPKAEPMQRRSSTRSASTSSHRSVSPPSTRRVYTPPSPVLPSKSAYPPPPPMARKSPPVSPTDKGPGVRFTNREPKTRPAGTRTFSQLELSTIDLKWGQLFENDGTPTPRLGQFLRGLANHIVDDYNPKKSIVVTPAKLTEYYSKFPIERELKGLTSIFKSQNNENISKFFQALGCQHFLIQDDTRNEPTIPALTPLGFAHLMTLMILAYPEEEAKRLEKVVLDCPIDADGQTVDGKPERLPKAISRHLLPEVEDRASKRLVDKAIEEFVQTSDKKPKSPTLSRNSSTSQARRPPVEIHQSAPKSKPIERERKPYAGTPSDNSNVSEDSVKIERERQPYSAQPGAGKVYDDSRPTRRESSGRRESRDRRESANRSDRRERESSTNGRRDSSMRRESTRDSTRRESSSSRTRDLPTREPTQHHRTQSNTSSNFNPPPQTQPRARRRRDSSPPIRNYGRHSEPVNLDSKYTTAPIPSSTYPGSATSTFPPPPPPIDIRTARKRGSQDYGRGEEAFVTGEFSSPREAERWDRLREEGVGSAGGAYEREGGRGSVDHGVGGGGQGQGAPVEDWYREPPRGTGYYASRGY